jgi:hypothetical protein
MKLSSYAAGSEDGNGAFYRFLVSVVTSTDQSWLDPTYV